MDAYRASNAALIVIVAALAVAVAGGASGKGAIFIPAFAVVLVGFGYAMVQWRRLADGETQLDGRGHVGTGEIAGSGPMRTWIATGGFGFHARPIVRTRVRVTLPGEDTYEAYAYGTSGWPVGGVHTVHVSKRNRRRIYIEPS